MEDEAIIELYWRRDEDAIRQTEQKYGRLCRTIAGNILASREDCEECVNDTWLGLWGAIPPKRPYRLSAFAGRITRNLALKRYAYLSAARRNPETVCSLEELGECVSGADCVESELESRRVRQAQKTCKTHTLGEECGFCGIFRCRGRGRFKKRLAERGKICYTEISISYSIQGKEVNA